MKQIATLVQLTVLLIGLSLLVACGQNYSNGERIGIINKFSNKGVVCKTWEGEMLLGGMRNSTDANGNATSVANIWEFYVPDGPLVDKVKHAAEAGKRTKMTYSQWMIGPVCSQGSSYTVTNVEELP